MDAEAEGAGQVVDQADLGEVVEGEPAGRGDEGLTTDPDRVAARLDQGAPLGREVPPPVRGRGAQRAIGRHRAPGDPAVPLEEAGEGESEGFELAEQQLIENASHGDGHNTTPILRDTRDNADEEEPPDPDLYGDADEVPSDVRAAGTDDRAGD